MKHFFAFLFSVPLLFTNSFMTPEAGAKNQWAVELGSSFVFRNAYPQVKVGYLLNDVFEGLEIGALYGAGIDNFQLLSHTGGIHVKQHILTSGYFQPFLQAGVMGAFRSGDTLTPDVTTLFGAAVGAGADGQIYGPWGYHASVHLVFPDIYSRSPFVFRPELNIRYVF